MEVACFYEKFLSTFSSHVLFLNGASFMILHSRAPYFKLIPVFLIFNET